jgi:hypothetical protein
MMATSESNQVTAMQKGHSLHFKCLSCDTPIHFSIFDLENPKSKQPVILPCSECHKKYSFSDPQLIRQLQQFEALCMQIHDSQEILGNASIGIDVGEHHVKVPFKLLLTRLSSCLDLNIDGKPLTIAFKIEPITTMAAKK